MKKIFTLLLMIAAMGSATQAQANISDTYERSGIALIYAAHPDEYNDMVRNSFHTLSVPTKFDTDDLPIDYMDMPLSRQTTDPNTRRQAIISKMSEQDYGKQLLSFLFDRRHDGTMDINRVLARGTYNATDIDVLKSQSTVRGVRAIGDRGFSLVKNNYILVLDMFALEREHKEDSKNVTWKAKINAYLFRINYSDQVSETFYNCWILDSDSEEQRAAKRAQFDNMWVGVDFVCEATTENSSTQALKKENLPEAINYIMERAYDDLLPSIEKLHTEWEVATYISRTRPIEAPIGTKEGLRNGQRYDVYEYTQRGGKLESERKGIIRATKIVKNDREATGGVAPTSKFYQIAGWKLQPGMTLKQNHDAEMLLDLGYRNKAKDGYFATFSFLGHIATCGITNYGLLEFGVSSHSVKNSPLLHDHDLEYEFREKAAMVDVGIGYGLGFRLARFFEFVPHVIVGAEFNSAVKTNQPETVEGKPSTLDQMGCYLTAGVRFNLSFCYPVYFFGGIDHTDYWYGGKVYNASYDMLKSVGRGRSGVGYTFGLRIAF